MLHAHVSLDARLGSDKRAGLNVHFDLNIRLGSDLLPNMHVLVLLFAANQNTELPL